MLNIAHAQILPLPPTDAEELRRSQQREEQERQRLLNAPDVRLQKEQPTVDTFDLPEESPCFQIKTFQLEGDQAGRFSWIGSYLSHYTGRCIGREGINLIAKRLTNHIISRGYITTRIGIPEQDISSGTLRFAVVPGVIRSIHFADEHLRGLWQTAFPARPGDLLNLRDLEQGLEQMKRLPYQDVDFDIKPGERPGESDVIIMVKRKKFWRGSLTFDNSGSEATGKLQGTVGLSLDNPLGINDLLSASYSHDVSRQGGRGTYGESFFYSLPFGYWTSTFTFNNYYYHQTVAAAGGDLKYSGKNTDTAVTVQRLIHRDQVSKTSLQFGINKHQAKTYLFDTEIETQRRNETVAEIGLYHRRYIGKSMLDLTISDRRGVPWFGAEPDTANSADGATTRYNIQTLDVSLNVPFTIADTPMRYLNHSRGQYTRDKLLVTDQFSIGNRYTVRGFDGEQTLLAERGWYIRNEIGIPVPQSRHEFYFGLDYGEVGGPSAGLLVGTRLAGSVVGLRGAFTGTFEGLSYDVFTGLPLYKPDGFHTAVPATGFQVTYLF